MTDCTEDTSSEVKVFRKTSGKYSSNCFNLNDSTYYMVLVLLGTFVSARGL